MKLDFGLHVTRKLDPCKQDDLCAWRHEVPYNLHILSSFSLSGQFLWEYASRHTTHFGFWYSLVLCARNPGTCNIAGSRVYQTILLWTCFRIFGHTVFLLLNAAHQ